MTKRRWLIPGILILLALTTLLAVDHHERQSAKERDRLELDREAAEARDRITLAMHDRLMAVEATRAFLQNDETTPTREQFDRFAAMLMQQEVSIRALQYTDEDAIIRYIYPLAGNEAALGLHLDKTTSWPFVEKAIRTRQTTVSDPVDLVQGGLGIVARAPLYRDNEFLGLAQGVFDVPVVITEALPNLEALPFVVQVQDAMGRVLRGPPSFEYDTASGVVAIGDNSWTVTVGWKEPPPGVSPTILFLIWGIGGALLLVLTFILYQEFGRSAQLERAVVTSEERYRALFDNANDSILVHDLDGDLVDVNRAACAHLGYSRDELLAMNLADIVAGTDEFPVPARMARLREQGAIVVETTHRRKDGKLIPVEVSSRVIEVGGHALAQAFVRDITRRKQAEDRQAALMEINQRLLVGAAVDTTLRFICQQVVGLFDLKMAWIGFKEADGSVRPIGAYGFEEGYLESVRVRWDDTPEGQGPTGQAIRTGEPSVMANIEHDPDYEPWHAQAMARGYRSSAAIPLRDDGHMFGALNVYAAQPDVFGEGTVQNLAGFAQQATIALLAAQSRQTLSESEARYRTLAEDSLVGVYVIQDGVFRYVNPALANAFGYTTEELIGKLGPNDLTAPEDRETVAENLRARLAGDVPALQYTFTGLRQDGSRFDAEVYGAVIEYDGRPAVQGTLIDISERTRAHAEQLRRARQMQLVNEVGRELMALRDPETVPERIVQRVDEAFGFYATTLFLFDEEEHCVRVAAGRGSVDDRVGHAPVSYAVSLGRGMVGMAAESRETQFAPDTSANPDFFSYEGLPDTNCEISVPLVVGDRLLGVLDIQEREVGALAYTDRQTIEAVAGMVAVALENNRLYVTERRRVEELALLNRIVAAATSSLDEESVLNIVCIELAQAFDLPQSSAALLNEDHTAVTIVADYAESADHGVKGEEIPIAGSPLAEMLMRIREPLAILDAQSDERAEFFRGLVQQRGSASLLLVPLVVRDEVVGVLSLASKEQRRFTDDESRLAKNVAAQATQALENARLYQELQQTLHKLRMAQDETMRTVRLQALGQMASGVVHDFNNILTSVLGYAELLLRDPDLPGKNRDFVERIRRAGINARESINRLREFYRPRDEQEPWEMVDLCELMRETVDLTAPRWKDAPQQKGAVLDVVTELTPMPWVPANLEQLREVLINLIFNAVDAMPDGGTLTLRAYAQDDNAVIEVADTGVGIPEDVHEQLFEPFFTTKGTAGTGLGLAMVHGIVRRHNGQVEVETEVGQGSLFRVILPVSGESGASDVIAPLHRLPSQNILLIDDDASVRDSISMMLVAMGHQITTAPSGQEGLALLETEGFNLVITDLGMPGMSGREVIEEIRTGWPGTPIILLTVWGQVMDMEKAPPLDADLIVTKPVSFPELEKALSEVLAAKAFPEK